MYIEGCTGTHCLPELIRDRQSKYGFETKEDDWFRTADSESLILTTINYIPFQTGPYYDLKAVKPVVDVDEQNDYRGYSRLDNFHQ